MTKVALVVAAIAASLISAPVYAQSCPEVRDRVCTLAPGYSPVPTPGQSYAPPRCGAVSPAAVDAIQAAFALAPANVQNDLCSVHKIFVLTNSSLRGWGKWEDPAHIATRGDCKDTLGRAVPCAFVAIDSSVLGRDLARVEDDNLRGLRISAGRHQHALGGAPTTRGRTLAVLAMLAHELGHIKFRRDNIRNTACFQSRFVATSWPDDGRNNPPATNTYQSRWVNFGQTIGRPNVRSPIGASAAVLREIYANGFASALAATSPEEDYVETYKMAALISARLPGILQINVGNSPIVVNSHRNHPVLLGKLSCVLGS